MKLFLISILIVQTKKTKKTSLSSSKLDGKHLKLLHSMKLFGYCLCHDNDDNSEWDANFQNKRPL